MWVCAFCGAFVFVNLWMVLRYGGVTDQDAAKKASKRFPGSPRVAFLIADGAVTNDWKRVEGPKPSTVEVARRPIKRNLRGKDDPAKDSATHGMRLGNTHETNKEGRETEELLKVDGSVSSSLAVTASSGDNMMYKSAIVGTLTKQSAGRTDMTGCKRWILYNKPVKTGSTSLAISIRRYLEAHKESNYDCQFETCTKFATEICSGKRAPGHLLGHIPLTASTLSCLREKGYYTVTSVREPAKRWWSAWRHMRRKNISHYSMNPQAPYSEFLENFPECSLLHYYDGRGTSCESLTERVAAVVRLYDEVVDVFSGRGGALWERVSSWVVRRNVGDGRDNGFVAVRRMAGETVLHKRLVSKVGRNLAKHEQYLCVL